jgi:hypothetical protein
LVTLRIARLATAAAVVGLGAFAAWHGANIVRFSLAVSAAATPAARAEAARPWTATPGLAAIALRASLTNISDAADVGSIRAREETLTALLAVHPLSADDWLSLAGTRLVARDSYDKVLGALAMSSLTGPNEGGVMLRRGTFGLVQWEVLPADARRRVIADLAGAILQTAVQDIEIAPAKNILSVKAADTRREIAALLQAEGLSAAQLATMGL